MLAHRCLIALASSCMLVSAQSGGSSTEFAGRLVDMVGAPIQHANGVSMILVPYLENDTHVSHMLGAAGVRADGRFTLRLQPSIPAFDRSSYVIDLLLDADKPSGQRYVRLPADLDFTPGLHELGDCVPGPSLVMAAGTVVDDLGEFVDDAEVHVVHPDSRADPEHSLAWMPDPNLFARGNTFDIRASVTPASVWVQAFAPGHLPSPPMRVQHGATKVRLEVTRFGWIEGDVRLDEEVSRAELPLFLSVRLSGQPDSTPACRLLPIPKDLHFRTSSLPPGRWDLTVEFMNSVAPLTTTIDLHAGRPVEDVIVDFRGKIPIRHLDIVDKTGARIESRPFIEQFPCCRLPVMSGAPLSMVTVLMVSEYEDLFAGADGYRLQHLGHLDQDQTVVLEPGLPVVFSLPKGIKLPSLPWRLAFTLRPLVPGKEGTQFLTGRGFSWEETFAFDAPGDVRLTMPTAGSCEVGWMLIHGDERLRLMPRRIQIEDKKEEQRIEFEPEPKQYAEWVAKYVK